MTDETARHHLLVLVETAQRAGMTEPEIVRLVQAEGAAGEAEAEPASPLEGRRMRRLIERTMAKLAA